jgi:5-(carboxyamino)imidazole ribonucleotide mutase
MPGGVPVGAMAIGEAGARNAGLMAARILALSDAALAARLAAFAKAQSDAVPLEVGAQEAGD